MDKIFSGFSAALGVLSIYIVIKYISRFKYEYKNNYAYVGFHILGILLLLIAFVEIVMFFLILRILLYLIISAYVYKYFYWDIYQ